jgi:hypothetical protein
MSSFSSFDIDYQPNRQRRRHWLDIIFYAGCGQILHKSESSKEEGSACKQFWIQRLQRKGAEPASHWESEFLLRIQELCLMILAIYGVRPTYRTQLRLYRMNAWKSIITKRKEHETRPLQKLLRKGRSHPATIHWESEFVLRIQEICLMILAIYGVRRTYRTQLRLQYIACMHGNQ